MEEVPKLSDSELREWVKIGRTWAQAMGFWSGMISVIVWANYCFWPLDICVIS